MKPKVIIIVLAVACIILGIVLSIVKKHAEKQHASDVTSLMSYSNQVVHVTLKNTDLTQANLALTNDLASSRQQSADLSNKLDSTSAALDATKSNLAEARGQISTLNSHIADLELQNKSLEKRTGELSNNVVQLDRQITVTSNQLAHAASANSFLQQELQRQMARRAELEHKLNDLAELRQQVKKIKNELFVARRLRLMQHAHPGQKGAELLMHPNVPAQEVTSEPLPVNGLNVEIGSDGSVRVIPPLAPPPAKTNANTNATAH